MGSEIHGLRPDMPFRDAAKPAIGKKLDELFEHEAGTRAGEDIEELHDMRVAVRRSRALLRAGSVLVASDTTQLAAELPASGPQQYELSQYLLHRRRVRTAR